VIFNILQAGSKTTNIMPGFSISLTNSSEWQN